MEGALLVENGVARRLSLAEAVDCRGRGFLWIHLEGRDEVDLAFLRDAHDVPDVAASALAATETRPRCDRVGEGAILNLRGPGDVDPEDSDKLVSIRFWVTETRVTTLSRRVLAATAPVIQAVEAGRINDPGDLIAAFAQLISRQLDPEVAGLGDTLDECETQLELRNAFRLRIRIAHIRSHAIGFRRFVAPNRDALLALAQPEFDWLGEDDRLHIREAADRFARMAEELEAVRERAALLHEQLTDMRGELLESRALAVAIVALLFLPLTFITGLFGMNVAGIPIATAPHAFWTITLLCVAIGAATGLYFWWRDWVR
ncbi:MAG: CorA family divalent cation transporter [Sphingosinicella sp.]